MKYQNIKEEELKNTVGNDYFLLYNYREIIGNVDFCVRRNESQKGLFETESFLWAEAKKGSSDIYKSIVQLVLTIGKARTFDKYLPPHMLGAFDGEKIAFIPYSDIHEVFYINDFNWSVAPSDQETKEFKLIYEKVKAIIDKETRLFYFLKDDKELKQFIRNNFIVGHSHVTQIRIDKNNFMIIYNKWLQTVKPTIAANWDIAKKNGIIDGDFYLADLLSKDNHTLKEKLFVLLEQNHYVLNRKINEEGMFNSTRADFIDKQVAHTQFWNKYERPPEEEYWDYIVKRRDLLVPQDVRERKGSFYTPQIWVELSQKYLADVLGENWQDEYYVWDCAAGTGNLLTGLTNKYNIWASTLDKQDVDVMHDRISNGANLLEGHVFQFDFLNDDFSKLPKSLQDIINNPKERKKLIIYINPPYAEATNTRTVMGTGENKPGVSKNNRVNQYFNAKIGNASNEIFALFMAQVYDKIPDVVLATFSTLKFIQGSNFNRFKDFFLAKYLKGFVIPSDTFDNVKGKFPIGFTIWNLDIKEKINTIHCDVYEQDQIKTRNKKFYGTLPPSINKWIKGYNKIHEHTLTVALIVGCPPDFQHNNQLAILLRQQERYCLNIYSHNLIPFCVYFSVRHSIEPTWLNDRDQFLYPNDGWEKDIEFQNDCLTFTLFSNNIQSKFGTNYWIPFTEHEVNSREKFESNFMSKFISGTCKAETNGSLLDSPSHRKTPLVFSQEAKTVFDAGRELWKYYHKQPNCNVNASLYDIREHFQKRNEAGKMNNKSDDETYTKLIGDLRETLKQLAKKIEPKVYEYGFLKE